MGEEVSGWDDEELFIDFEVIKKKAKIWKKRMLEAARKGINFEYGIKEPKGGKKW